MFPAVTPPVLSTEGLPLGLQIMGFAGGDARLFATAAPSGICWCHNRSATARGVARRRCWDVECAFISSGRGYHIDVADTRIFRVEELLVDQKLGKFAELT